MSRRITFAEHLTRYRVSPTGCWEWAGPINDGGYGVINLERGKTVLRAHRAMYEAVHGKLESRAIKVLHTCDNPPCINPDHLVSGSQADNVRDMIEKGRKAVGEKANSRLTEESVRNIRSLYACGLSRAEIARRVSTAPTNVFAIVNRRTWRHVL